VIVLVASLVLLPIAGGLWSFIARQEHRPRSLETVQLRFGRDVKAESVEALISGISGLARHTPVVVEVLGDARGVKHRLHAEPRTLELLRSQLRGVLPSLRFDPLPPGEPLEHDWKAALRLRYSGSHPVLNADQQAETAAALLGAFSALRPGEALRLCWVLSPTPRPGPLPDHNANAPASFGMRWLSEPQPSPEHLRALRKKYSLPIVSGRAIVMASGNDSALLGRVTAILRSRQSGFGRLYVQRQRPLPLSRLISGFNRSNRFSPSELAGLLGFPIDAPRIPGLTLTTAPQLMPAVHLPRTGRIFARSDWPGMENHQLAQPVVGGLSHGLIVGPTGSGKSHLLANLVCQDLSAGRGCLVFDGKGDLAREVLARIPKRMHADVIVLDPSARLPLPGLRVFARGDDPELTADLLLGIFRELFADSWGIRSDKWLRAGLVTLAHDSRATLANLPQLFSDERYRRELVGGLRDPLLKSTWAAYEAMSQRERDYQLGSPLTKVGEIISRQVVRAVLAQPEPKLDMRDVLATGKVVIVSLSPGRIGAPAARLLGAVIFHQLFQAIHARAAVALNRRRPFFVYVDEPKVLADMPVPLDSLFEMARGLGVGLTLGAQSLAQLPKTVAQAALTNAASIVAFKQSADDAGLLARELLALTAEELQGLGKFEVAVRLGLGPGDIAPVATGVTLPLPKPISDPRAIRRLSAERYGTSLNAVDRALEERHGEAVPAVGAVPVGRLRRSP
jgi:hypothetical protein